MGLVNETPRSVCNVGSMDLTDAQWADPRTDVPSAPAARWPRAAVDGCPRRAERRALGAAHRRAVARSAARAIRRIKRAIGAFSSGSAAAVSTGSCSASPRICATAARSISPKPSSTPPSPGRKKGALPLALPAVVKGARSWRSATAMVFLSPCTWPALRRMKPHLVPATLDARFLPDLPARLIGDRGYDSDPLDDAARRERTASR